jgi:hypothetical protein
MKTFILLFVFILCTVSLLSFSGNGSGTESDPYKITTVEQLQEMNDDLDANYILMNDIDASQTRDWNVGDHDGNPETPDSAMGFEPVGTYEDENPQAGFTGSLDGQDFEINELFINRPAEDYVGLYGCIADGGYVYDTNIDYADIKGNSNVGVFVGKTFAYSEESDVIIEGCSISGSVFGVSNFVGGFCGVNYSENGIARILDSYSSAIVTGYFDVGGFCGLNFSDYNSSSISESYSSGFVSGYSYVGGFCGVNFTNYGIARLSDCYAIGDVTGNDKFIGGFCSKNYLLDSSVALSIIERCYSTGYLSGNSNLGGFCVFQDTSNFSKITSCYWDTQTSGITESDGGEGKTTAEMMMQSTFENWDFDNIWCIVEGKTYPRLQHFVDCDTLVSVPQREMNSEIILYPHPVKDIVTLEYSVETPGFVRISIYDINGLEQLIIPDKFHLEGDYSIDIITSDFMSGTYFIEIESASGISTKQVMVIK